MAEDRAPLAATRGVGALLQTDTVRVPLGDHRGHRLTARVQHRSLRFAVGRGRHVSLTLGRSRAVALEVARLDVPSTEAGAAGSAAPYDEIALPAPPEPWVRAARRVLLVAAGCWLLTQLTHRARRSLRRAASERE